MKSLDSFQRIQVIFAVLVLAFLSLVPVSPQPAEAGTVLTKGPGEDGYVPCNCACVTVLGKKYCWCICEPA